MKYPWWIPPLSGDESHEITKVLQKNYINDGELVYEVETNLSKIINSKFVLCTSSGTSAITLFLMAIGLNKNSVVGVSNITFIATANAAAILGCKVILLDVDEKSGIIKEEELSKQLKIGLDLVIITHVSGRDCLPINLRRLLQQFNTPFIEDSAEALGSRLQNGTNLGLSGVGGTFSFSPNKILTSGQGGFLATNSKQLFLKAKAIKNQGRKGKSSGGDDKHELIGWNFKWTNIQAAMIKSQLKYLQKRVEILKMKEYKYREIIEGSKNIRLNDFGMDQFKIYLWPEIQCRFRSELEKKLKFEEIGYRNMWFPINSQIPYRNLHKKFPGSNTFSRKTLWLSSDITLDEKSEKRLMNKFKKIVREIEAL
jgi:dTDP-4-amino-4,6-dideoxygalactose transaminase